MKLVLDTNVLVSGTFWTGDSYKIIKKIDLNEIVLVLSKELIEEYSETINSDEIMEKAESKDLIINATVKRIFSSAIIVFPQEKLNVVKEDSDDNRILECAVEGKVNYIISQDNHLLKLREFQEIKILTPEEFLKIIEKSC